MCAKLVCKKGKFDSNTDCLKHLHWLPVRLRISYKILSIVHKCMYGKAPEYLKVLINVRKFPRKTRQAVDKTLQAVPLFKKKTFAARSFAYAGPYLWNSLPSDVRELDGEL